MGFYNDRILPRLVHMSMRQPALVPVLSQNSVEPVLGGAIVVVEHPADSLAASNGAGYRLGRRRVDQRIADSLVVALEVIVRHEFTNQSAKMPFAERQDAIQAFLFDGSHEAFGVRIGQRQQLRLMRTIRHEPFV